MKKNLFLRLCLMLGLLSLNSCRQDILNEHETYNNSGAFQLTSKRISLNEAQHKTNLIPKIKQVETNLYGESKNNLQGKTVNFGNGISIDTDDVIYLEKGPDFHSYTFRINHENAPDNAPIENLVISSRPDGTWKEVLVTYYLTAQERQNLLSGGTIDFTGKVTHEILQNGTYSSAIMQQDVMTCYLEVNTYYTRCGDTDDHHNGELTGTAGPCRSETPSVLVVSLVRKCTVALPVDTGLGENGEGGGSGPQNGPGGLSNNPPEETTTVPNVPTKGGTPCEKIKTTTNTVTGLKDKLKSLNTTANLSLNYEKGAIVTEDAQGNTTLTPKDGNAGQTSIAVVPPSDGSVLIYAHTHFNGSDMMPTFTFDDLEVFEAINFWRVTNNKPINKATLYVVTSEGTFAVIIDNSIKFYNMGGKIVTDREDMERKFYGKLKNNPNVNVNDYIKQVAKVLPDYGVSLYKAEDENLNNWKKLIYNPETDQLEMPLCN